VRLGERLENSFSGSSIGNRSLYSCRRASTSGRLASGVVKRTWLTKTAYILVHSFVTILANSIAEMRGAVRHCQG
jgi:hypothetical protein